MQVTSETENGDQVTGFIGGTFLGDAFGADVPPADAKSFRHGHIAMTYTALCTLHTLGDDWSRVDRKRESSRLYNICSWKMGASDPW